ncbi:MAG: peptidylprolyl isomerase [Pseudomonadota bacterium]
MSTQERARLPGFMSEPLLHFLAIGAAIFLVYALVAEPEPLSDAGTELVVQPEVAEQLVVGFRQTWRRNPTDQELGALLANYVREEILVREAEALSLDVNDPIIRRRLAQKMEFLIDSAAGAGAPTEEQLQAFFDQTQTVFATEPRLAFEQVFVGPNPSVDEVEEVLISIEAGAPAAQLGQASLLPRALRLSARPAVDGTFGTGFFVSLSEAEIGKWFGPVRSGFGVHIARVIEREGGGVPALAEIRDQVEAAWRTTQSEEVAAEFYARLEDGYAVTLPSDDILQGLLE